jgi:N-acetylglucosaminyldiphosphoundecaprenol N-acetyl-beta-D-mannosaminyltransferase
LALETGFPAKRISVLRIPLDVLSEDKIEEAVKRLLQTEKTQQIILLSVWDLMRARRNTEFRAMVNNAGLVIPISLSLVKGARFLKRETPIRYMPFDFIIRLLGALEASGKTVYLLGSRKKTIKTAERNIKATFPGVRVVGRYSGFYKRSMEADIVQAVRKATPSLLMIGRGVPGKERWIPRNLKHFESGLFLWCDDVFDIFAEKRKRVSRGTFKRGLEWIPYTFARPWKFARIFTFFWYKILLLAYRVNKW